MRILIAERSLILRKRLTRLFSDLGYISLVAFVEELNDVKKTALQENPDVIVMDINYPNHTNLLMMAALKEEIIHAKVIIILTETSEPRYIKQFQEAGADVIFNIKDDLNKFIGHLNLMDELLKNTSLVR